MFLDSANPVVRSAVQVPQSPFNSLHNKKTSSTGTSLASSPKACYMRHHPNTATIWSRQTETRWLKRTLWEKHNDTLGPGSSVGIATGYGLDNPRIETRWGRDFPHLSRLALGPTQPPVQWVLGLSRRKEGPERDADLSPPSSAVVMKG